MSLARKQFQTAGIPQRSPHTHTKGGTGPAVRGFAELAGDCQVTLSAGRTGQCWDNALSESFFSSIKGELPDLQPWPAKAGARRAIVEYIGWFNGTRLHSALDYLSPAEFEATTGNEVLKKVA